MDNDLLALFEDGLQRFNRERYSPAQLVAYTREAAGDSSQRWSEMAGMGWFELLRADAEDGADAADSVARLLPIFRAAGEGLWREPVACALGESAVVAAHVSAPGRRAALVEGLVSGAHPLAYAARESGDGWSRAQVLTQARKNGEGHALQGKKIAIAGYERCAGFVVLAQSPELSAGAFFLVQRDAPGLELLPYKSVEGRWIADLQMNGTPAEYLCPAEIAERAEAWGAILAAAEAVGIMRGANADTTEYLLQRRQFGRALLSFQVLQHRLVEMHMLERETDALLQATAEAFDTGAPAMRRRLLMLRAQSSRALRQVTREAVQMHGGMGVTQETRVSHYYRRALMLDSAYGAEDWALEQLAAA
jgi:alkylation response protein AidB-like acyl-CoA dehydrogenase